MASRDDGSPPRGTSAYYCHQCQDAVFASPPALICPDCNGGFLELYSNFDASEQGLPDAPVLFQTDSEARHRFLDTFSVENISDLLENMPLYGDFYGDQFLSESVEPQIPPGFSSDDVVMDTAEWDRVLAWYFENEGALMSEISRLPEEQIESIPVCFMKAKDIERTSTCSICFDDFKLMEEAKILPCKHLFHKECIVSWLRVRANCPVCRQTAKAEECARGRGVAYRARATNSSLREVAGASGESSREERSDRLSEISCDNLAYPSTSRSRSSGTFPHRQRTVNHTSDVQDDEQSSHDGHSSLRSSNTNRRWHVAAHSAHVRPGERPPRRRTQYGSSQRNHSAHVPSGRRALHRPTFSFADSSLEGGNLMPYASDLMQPNVRSASLNGFPFQSQQSSTTNSASHTHYQRNPRESSFDDSSNRHRSSDSGSLEDLSSVVPVLPTNVVL